MFSRRGFIRIGAASVGTLALRPFGLCLPWRRAAPIIARWFACFCTAATIPTTPSSPWIASYHAYQSIRGVLGLSTGALTPVTERERAHPMASIPCSPNWRACSPARNWRWSPTSGRWCRPSRSAQYQAAQAPIPSNLFSHADQQQQWADLHGARQLLPPAGPDGRADYVAAQNMNSSDFPTFLSVAGNALEGVGVKTQQGALTPGQSHAFGRLQQLGGVASPLGRADQST